MRQRVAGDGPRTDQNNDRQGVKSLSEVPPAENFPGCPGGCLSAVCVPWSSVCVSGSWPCGCLFLPGVGCWVPVSGALAPSLVVGCCPCLPGSGSCTGFREKGRRPKNRSRRSIARAGLFQVFPGMLAVLERRYRGRILTLVHIVVYSPPSQLRRFLTKCLHVLSTHRRGPVEEPPRAERALRGGLRFLQCLSSLLFASIVATHVPLYRYVFSSQAISEVAESLDVRGQFLGTHVGKVALGVGKNPRPTRTMSGSCRDSPMKKWRLCTFLHSMRNSLSSLRTSSFHRCQGSNSVHRHSAVDFPVVLCRRGTFRTVEAAVHRRL